MTLAGKAKFANFYNAFSVVEVLVVLGVVAVLMTLGGFAIAEAQRVGRVQDRINKAGEIASAINDYLREQATLPSETNGSFVWEENQVRIGTQVVELRGFLKYQTSPTTTQGTNYLFAKEFGKYQICVQQEDRKWEGAGSGSNLCPE